MRCKEREMGCGWGEGYTINVKFLTSITVFNKFQADGSSGFVKFMPLAIMLQRKQNHPLGVTVTIILSSIFLLFQPTLKNNNNNNSSFTIYFSKKVFMTQQSLQETIRAQKRQEGAGQRENGERKQECITHSQDISWDIAQVRHSANCHMPWQRYQQQQCAQGAVLSLAPHPAVVETHLAPCWTFIRPDSHQMVSCFGSWAVWPWIGMGGGSHISALRGAQIGVFLSDRCQGRGGGGMGKGTGCKAILYVCILWHETFGKGREKY